MRIAQNLIFLPMLVQAVLTIAVLIALFPARVASMRTRRQSLRDITVATDAAWERQALKVSNNYKSQFELPVLFYVACVLALALRQVDIWFLSLAFLFTLSRIVHSGLHIGSEWLVGRFLAFCCGLIIVVALWVLLTVRLVAAGF